MKNVFSTAITFFIILANVVGDTINVNKTVSISNNANIDCKYNNKKRNELKI